MRSPAACIVEGHRASTSLRATSQHKLGERKAATNGFQLLPPCVPHRSRRPYNGIIPRENLSLSSSVFVYVCRRRGQEWGQAKQPTTLIPLDLM